MSDLTRYRIDWKRVNLLFSEEQLIELESCVEPDSTLQDIADEWEMSWQKEIRELSPGLAALLDALEGADK